MADAKMRKIPLRMCVGCRTKKPKQEMIRVVKTPEDEIVIDKKGKVSGRGAYVCYDPDCFLKAQKSKAISRMLETEISPEVYETLRSDIEKHE